MVDDDDLRKCGRCGLRVSAGACDTPPLVFHTRPQQCIDDLKTALAAAREQARTAEETSEAMRIQVRAHTDDANRARKQLAARDAEVERMRGALRAIRVLAKKPSELHDVADEALSSPPTPTQDCQPEAGVSRTCERGTRTCTIKHSKTSKSEGEARRNRRERG